MCVWVHRARITRWIMVLQFPLNFFFLQSSSSNNLEGRNKSHPVGKPQLPFKTVALTSHFSAAKVVFLWTLLFGQNCSKDQCQTSQLTHKCIYWPHKHCLSVISLRKVIIKTSPSHHNCNGTCIPVINNDSLKVSYLTIKKVDNI